MRAVSSMEKSRVCNGCLCMAVEDWPKGAKACRCMSPDEPTGSIQHFGRVMDVFSMGVITTVYRPAWCPKDTDCHASVNAGSQ